MRGGEWCVRGMGWGRDGCARDGMGWEGRGGCERKGKGGKERGGSMRGMQ